jgi:hypothetical protein
MEAQADQTNEHYEQQANVGGAGGDRVEFGSEDVNLAGVHYSHP